MKNYTIVSRMCDEIAQAILSLELDATDPTKPDYLRIFAQRRLALVRDLAINLNTTPYCRRDEDLPF